MYSSRCSITLAALLALPIVGSAVAEPAPQATTHQRNTSRGMRLPAVHELQDVRVEPQVRECVDDLAAASYERREEAMDRLMDSRVSVEQLCAALQEPQLTPEQEYRLLMIVRRELLTAPRGAVGIKVDQRWMPNQIIIEDLIEGLPAAEVLKVGDRITHLQGQVLATWNDFRRTIQSKAPGDLILMTVERPIDGVVPIGPDRADPEKFETTLVEMKLGSAELLIDADTGLPQRNGDIDRMRLSAANEATRRYAPRAMTMQLDGTDDVVVKHKYDFEVESNTHIQNALREREQIMKGALVLTTERRAERIRQLEVFKRLSNNPTLTPQVRDMHRRLAERYAELIRR